MFTAMSTADQIVYSSLLVVGLLLLLVIVWGLRQRRLYEEAGRALQAKEVGELSASLLPGKKFVWGNWQKQFAFAGDELRVQDENGTVLTVISRHHIPKGLVLSEFVWQGTTLEYVRAGMLSTRNLLRERDSGKVLYSCRHDTLKTLFFRGESDEELFRIPYTTVFHRYSRIVRGDREIGRRFLVPRVPFLVPVVSVQGGELSLLEQVFVLVCR